MATLLQDLKYGLRMLAKNPGFTLVAVVTLALGIGANTAIFSVVNAALLHPLPFRDSGRLVTQWGTIPAIGYSGPLLACDRDYAAWRDQNRVFERIGAYGLWTVNLTGAGEPVRLIGSQVTASLFPLLGVSPSLGRNFAPDEDQPRHDHEVLLSNKLWRGRFRADPAVVGRSIRLNDELYAVIGVMPAGFGFPNQSEFWTPVAVTNDCSNTTLLVIARLKPGVTLGKAEADISVISRRLNHGRSSSDARVTLVPLAKVMGADLRPVLVVLLAAVGLVLLIACANVANLLLARAAARQHEIAIRKALGASRGRIILQMLMESVLLAVLGGALGLLLAVWGHGLLTSSIALLPQNLASPSVRSRIATVGVEGWVLSFTLIVSLLTGIVFGLAPALEASKSDLNEALKEGGRTLSESLGRGRVRNALVIGEIAVSLVLLIGAGLLVRSLISLARVKPGFDPANVLTMNVNLPPSRYQAGTQMIAFKQQALERLRVLPGVLAAGEAMGLPLSGPKIRGDVTIEGQPAPPPNVLPGKLVVGGDYFRALGIPLLEGRYFSRSDAPGAPRVAIVSASMARRFWPGESAVGRRLKPGFPHDSWCTIVGVVGDVKMFGLDETSSLALYLPYDQATSPFLMRDLTFVLRIATNPTMVVPAARRSIESVDSDLPVFDVATMKQVVYQSISEPRFNAFLLGIFAALALALASVGIYGVMSYAVAQRTHEIGVRMALGAQRQDVMKLIVSRGALLALAGVGIGIAGALVLTRFLAGFLFGVRPTDLPTYILVSLALASVAVLACYIPARRAAKVDPMVALRYE